MDRETYVELLNRLAEIENKAEVTDNFVAQSRDAIGGIIDKLMAQSERIVALEVKIAALTEQIISLSHPSSISDSQLLMTSELQSGDVVRLPGGEWRTFGFTGMGHDGFYIHWDGVPGYGDPIPSLCAKMWERKS